MRSWRANLQQVEFYIADNVHVTASALSLGVMRNHSAHGGLIFVVSDACASQLTPSVALSTFFHHVALL